MKNQRLKSVWQLINTIVPFIILWYLAYKSLSVSYWLTLVPALLAAGFMTRIFIIFHDCTHYSFFKSRRANRIVGTCMGVLTLFPFDQWGHEHSIHHATSGNLDKRGTGDIWTLTVDEYVAAPFRLRLAYRLYRNPFVMFGLGPIYVFLLKIDLTEKVLEKERMNTYLTNILIVAIVGMLCWAIGWQSFLLVHGSIFLIAGSIGFGCFTYSTHSRILILKKIKNGNM